MKIVIAPDSYKESLSAQEVCQAVQTGFSAVFPQASFVHIPMADGGEGTAAALKDSLNGHWQSVNVHDPLMRPITAQYVILPDNTAVIEMATAAGLHLLTPKERNPLVTSSYGVGEMIADALQQGVTNIILGIGGSATNDGGQGMLQALGYRFFDEQKQPLPQGGAALAKLATIDDSQIHPTLASLTITVACDVNNPLCGEYGASAVYAPQKGATPEQVVQLDKALANFATVVRAVGLADCQHQAGAGAAGGLGFGLMAFLQAKLVSGFELVSQITQLEKAINEADLVITGEGKMDFQTHMGKVASGVLALAKQADKPVIAICGGIDDPNMRWREAGFHIAIPSIQKLGTLEETLSNAKGNVEKTAYNLAVAMKLGQRLAKNSDIFA